EPVQRWYTLPFVLTLGTACGSEVTGAPTGPTPPPAPPSQHVVMQAVPPPDAPPPDAREAPKLACEGDTQITLAPAPDPTMFCARGDGTRHGAFVTLFPDETIAVSGSYRDGKLDGA